MSRIAKLAIAASALTLTALPYAWSQPGGGGGRGGGGGGGGFGGFGISAEQILGYLALDPAVNLTDAQLIQVRNALRSSYRDQVKMREEMRSGGGAGEGDPQRLREEMAAMREGIMTAVKANLTEAQFATFSAAQERMQQGGRGQGGGRRGGGGAQ